MHDPFPIPPIKLLQHLVQPIVHLFGLETLHLHVHEIFYAFIFYHLIFVYISPTLSIRYLRSHYLALSNEGRMRWNMKSVSFLQSTLISTLSLWVMYHDKERSQMSLEERVWGYTGAAGMVQGLAVGYFVWDTYIMARYTEVFGTAMLAHGLACSLTFSLGFRPVLNYYGCVFMLYELSTPLLNIHWILDKTGMTGTPLQIYNGVALITTFFAVRLVYGGLMSVHIYSDVWRALWLDCGKINPRQEFEAKDSYGYSDSLTNCPLPWWLLCLYLGGHITLNSLNVYWFGAMIRAIRKRADVGRKMS